MRFKPKMTAEYSIYPALPSDTHNTSLPPLTSSHQNCIPASSHPALYQYHKFFTATFGSGSGSANFVQDDNSGNGNDTVDSSPSLSISITKRNSNSPAITRLASIMEATETNTDSKSPSLPDRTASSEETTEHQHHDISFNPHTPYHFSSSNHHHPHPHQHSSFIGDSNSNTDSNTSVSSNETTPSDSTASTPFSTPTRLAPSTCQMTSSGAAAAAAAQAATVASTASIVTTKTSVIECKKSSKFDPRLSPSPYRQLLPIALCILSFATVFSILIVYMDTTEIRHQQFRLNMSRDYELLGVAQDDPTLIAFLREIHMKKYPMHFLKKTPEEHLNFTEHHELTPEMAHYVADLVGGKLNGAVIQSLPGQMGTLMTAPWLAETLNWAGVIIEPEPRRYFTLRKQNAHRSKMQVVHACVSPNKHPKEVTIHNEEAEVRINSLLDEETSWFNSRVKCFPLYTIMLASNRIDFDLLSLGVHGRELEILQTLPYNVVNIEVISIHLPEDHENVRGYIQSVTKFLMGKSYRLQKTFGRNYFYQKLNTNRTRKKDIFTKKP